MPLVLGRHPWPAYVISGTVQSGKPHNAVRAKKGRRDRKSRRHQTES